MLRFRHPLADTIHDPFRSDEQSPKDIHESSELPVLKEKSECTIEDYFKNYLLYPPNKPKLWNDDILKAGPWEGIFANANQPRITFSIPNLSVTNTTLSGEVKQCSQIDENCKQELDFAFNFSGSYTQKSFEIHSLEVRRVKLVGYYGSHGIWGSVHSLEGNKVRGIFRMWPKS